MSAQTTQTPAGIAPSARRMRSRNLSACGPSLVPRLIRTACGVTSRSSARNRTSPSGVVRPALTSQTIARGSTSGPRYGCRPVARESPTTSTVPGADPDVPLAASSDRQATAAAQLVLHHIDHLVHTGDVLVLHELRKLIDALHLLRVGLGTPAV